MFSISRWLLMISLTDRYFLASFLSVLNLLILSYLCFCTRFYLNSQKLNGFSPYFLHFQMYCFSSSSIAILRFYNAYCFCLCLAFNPYKTSFCLRISSTSLVSFDPSSFFSFFSINFSCFLLTAVRFFKSQCSSRICSSFFLILASISRRSSAVYLCLLFFFCKFLSSF